MATCYLLLVSHPMSPRSLSIPNNSITVINFFTVICRLVICRLIKPLLVENKFNRCDGSVSVFLCSLFNCTKRLIFWTRYIRWHSKRRFVSWGWFPQSRQVWPRCQWHIQTIQVWRSSTQSRVTASDFSTLFWLFIFHTVVLRRFSENVRKLSSVTHVESQTLSSPNLPYSCALGWKFINFVWLQIFLFIVFHLNFPIYIMDI